MSTDNKMASFLALEIAWVCLVATFIEPILNNWKGEAGNSDAFHTQAQFLSK